MPTHYTCDSCADRRPVLGSHACPGCWQRRCKDCRCGGINGCPTNKLSSEAYEKLTPVYLIEEDPDLVEPGDLTFEWP